MLKKVIDLFAGAGGLSEGFRRAGFDIISHVEMDKDASLTLKTREAYYYCKENNKMDLYINYLNHNISRDNFYKNIPKKYLNKVINQEISDETIIDIFEKIDVLLENSVVTGIIGGPPCQAYSIAGRSRQKNKMENDPRNFLYLQYLKFINKYSPDFFVFENVQGLLSAKEGTVFIDIQEKMKSLGYSIEYKILDSSDFGVAQTRKRIIIIGFKDTLNIEYPKFNYNFKKCNVKELFNDLPFINAGEANNIYKEKINACLKYLKIRDENWNTLTYHKSRSTNDNDKKIYKLCVTQLESNNKNMQYFNLPKNLIKHNNTNCFSDRFKVVDYNKPCHTMVAHISKDGHHYIHPDIKQNRSITVREAARIQSFPDDYYFESSQTNSFKQIGNAVPVFMAEQIAIKIEELL